ncbi:hypothetical protein [Arthrobacter sp. TmT3-37]
MLAILPLAALALILIQGFSVASLGFVLAPVIFGFCLLWFDIDARTSDRTNPSKTGPQV